MNILPGAIVEWYLDPIAWSAIATAVATIAYAVISIGLWKATKQTAILTQRMFDAERGGIAARRRRSGKPPERHSLSEQRAAEPPESKSRFFHTLRGGFLIGAGSEKTIPRTTP